MAAADLLVLTYMSGVGFLLYTAITHTFRPDEAQQEEQLLRQVLMHRDPQTAVQCLESLRDLRRNNGGQAKRSSQEQKTSCQQSHDTPGWSLSGIMSALSPEIRKADHRHMERMFELQLVREKQILDHPSPMMALHCVNNLLPPRAGAAKGGEMALKGGMQDLD